MNVFSNPAVKRDAPPKSAAPRPLPLRWTSIHPRIKPGQEICPSLLRRFVFVGFWPLPVSRQVNLVVFKLLPSYGILKLFLYVSHFHPLYAQPNGAADGFTLDGC